MEVVSEQLTWCFGRLGCSGTLELLNHLAPRLAALPARQRLCDRGRVSGEICEKIEDLALTNDSVNEVGVALRLE